MPKISDGTQQSKILILLHVIIAHIWAIEHGWSLHVRLVQAYTMLQGTPTELSFSSAKVGLDDTVMTKVASTCTRPITIRYVPFANYVYKIEELVTISRDEKLVCIVNTATPIDEVSSGCQRCIQHHDSTFRIHVAWPRARKQNPSKMVFSINFDDPKVGSDSIVEQWRAAPNEFLQ